MYTYFKESKKLFKKIIKTNKTSIKKASELISECILKDTIIHAFGTGHSHMVGLELFIRAGGLANVNAMLDSTTMTSEGAQRSAEIERIEGFSKVIWDQHKINKGDIIIIISNSGRNAMPIEMAMIAKKNNIPIIVITSMQQTKKYPSRHSSEKKLYEMADIVIDNCVPSGDGMFQISGSQTGAASSISGIFIVNLISTEAMQIADKKGCKLPLYHSQNIDGYSNEELYKKYGDRVKHM
ncbi:MAG: sugar isomerase domain-containing protein [Flavobacteriaceae bacterium]